MTDLQVQYKDKRSAINSELAELKKHLSVHARIQKANSKDWGYVGDLVRVNRLLREILEAV
jgi:hypothetical protein